jgi:hypothetical protein
MENSIGEESIQMSVGVKERLVIVAFDKPVAWLRTDPEGARKLATLLMERANEADTDPILRAGGDCPCYVCGDLYRNHPHDMKQLDYNGKPFLKVRCDGRRLKL